MVGNGSNRWRFAVDRPRAVITVGVTGHRALTPAEETAAGRAVAAVLATIDAILHDEHHAGCERRIVTALAAGADQVAVAAAGPGWASHAMLPFDRASYRAVLTRDLGPDVSTETAGRFDRLLAAAERRFELADLAAAADPDEARRYTEARRYRTAGRIVVAQCDLLVAIWRGGPPRGPGGTADCVADALAQRIPVVRIDPASGMIRLLAPEADDTDLLWRVGHEPGIGTDDPALRSSLASLVRAWLGLPPGDHRPGSAAHFLGLGRYRTTGREAAQTRSPATFGLFAWFQWALLAGSGLARRPNWRLASDALARDWAGEPVPAATVATDAALGPASIAADAIATTRGNVYRSGCVATFLGATAAVLAGLLGLADEAHKARYVTAELALLIATIALFARARARRCHVRWLNAREVAERLRAERALAWLGMAGRRASGERIEWPQWLANAVLAQPGIPDTILDRPALGALARSIRDRLVAPQIAYHRRNAAMLRQVHRRLDRIGWVCVLAALAAAIVFLAVAWSVPPPPHWLTHLVAIVGAGAPLVAAAAAGIRFQGDFERFGDRSTETTHALAALSMQLDRFATRADGPAGDGAPLLFEELVAMGEALAAVLRADSDDWRFVYAARPLPGVG